MKLTLAVAMHSDAKGMRLTCRDVLYWSVLEQDELWFDRQLTPAFLFEHDPTGHARGHAFRKTGFHPRIKSEGRLFPDHALEA